MEEKRNVKDNEKFVKLKIFLNNICFYYNLWYSASMFQIINNNLKKLPLFFENQLSKIIKSFLYLFIFFAWGIIILSTAQNFI